MFDDEDDDLFAPPPPSRARKWTLLVGFAVLMSAAGVITWHALPESITRFASPEEVARPRLDAEVPPQEYQELRRMARRRLHDAEVVRAIELVRHPDPGVRREALRQLALIRGGPLRGEAAGAAAQALGDDYQSVRLTALSALGELRAREHERDVRELLGSDDEPTQAAARQALERMRRPDPQGAAHR